MQVFALQRSPAGATSFSRDPPCPSDSQGWRGSFSHRRPHHASHCRRPQQPGCRERGEQGWRAGGGGAEDHAGGRNLQGGAREDEELHRWGHGELRR
jgi:hypothetical protein